MVKREEEWLGGDCAGSPSAPRRTPEPTGSSLATRKFGGDIGTGFRQFFFFSYVALAGPDPDRKKGDPFPGKKVPIR